MQVVQFPARAQAGSAVRAQAQTRSKSLVGVELVAAATIVLAAVGSRLPNLLVIPAFTDEVEEIQLGLSILRDGARPLTNVDPYIGPFWNYLLAGAFSLFGTSIAVPRGLAMAGGVLTVLLAFLLGKVWFGPRTALLGALLLGTSAAHIVVNSHIAWSNCITPVFTTAGLLLIALAIRDDRPRLAPAAGLLFGLAFHTHPTAAPVVVGAAAAILASRRGWLLTPWPYLAGVAGGLVNLNLVVYNLMTGGRTFRYAQEVQSSYVQETGEAAGYLERVGDLLLGLVRTLGSALDRRASVLDYATDPLLLLAGILLVGGLVLAVRRRAWLQLGVVISAVLVLPLVNPKYDPILNVRYLAPILPICMLWIGAALDGLAQRISAWANSTKGVPSGLTGVLGGSGTVLAASLILVMVAGSIAALNAYYADVRENARTGERILEVVRTARQAGAVGIPVVLDERLDRIAIGPGAGIVLRVLKLAFDLEGIPTEVRWLGERRPADIHPGQIVVLAARSKPQFTAEAVSALGLQAVNGGPARVHSQASRYGLYRFGPAGSPTQASYDTDGGAPDGTLYFSDGTQIVRLTR
ncbi:MAG: glycosyltransferase family 39 protein [Chloroflexi bacterium]|nr:glycosyltransferase family 39 protein [Chloroflexota bacterium]